LHHRITANGHARMWPASPITILFLKMWPGSIGARGIARPLYAELNRRR
jgi:hypothetical protein